MQVGEKEFSLKLLSLKITTGKKKPYIKNKMLYIPEKPYGLEKGKNFILYTPGYLVADMKEGAQLGASMILTDFETGEYVKESSTYILYNKKTKRTFVEENWK